MFVYIVFVIEENEQKKYNQKYFKISRKVENLDGQEKRGE